MNATLALLLALVLLCAVVESQWVIGKVNQGLIDRDDDYWVIKTNGVVNRPTFPSYIRFYNTRAVKSEYQLDCSISPFILYYQSEIIFRTTGHFWSEGDSYYVTLDDGVLYSDSIKNSTRYSSTKFWQFSVVRPRDTGNAEGA